MTKRQKGYYWIKTNKGDEWTIAEYYPKGNCWYLPGLELLWSDSEIYKIDENKITRGIKQWKKTLKQH